MQRKYATNAERQRVYRERKRGKPARVLVESERLRKLETVEARLQHVSRTCSEALHKAGRHACPAVEALARISESAWDDVTDDGNNW